MKRPFRKLCVLLLLLLAASIHLHSQHQELHLKRSFGDLNLCKGQSFLQFLDETELVGLVAPKATCYANVNSVHIIAFNTSGQIVASKPWPSTFPIVARRGHLYVGDLDSVTVLNERLDTSDHIAIPECKRKSSTVLTPDPQGGMYVRVFGCSAYRLAPADERLSQGDSTQTPNREIVEDFNDQTVRYVDGKLVVTRTGVPVITPDVRWVQSCDKSCQQYGAGVSVTYAEENRDRLLLQANGSRFPITDAAGLFPYYRVLMVDLASGKEIFRQEFASRTDQRQSALSPSGSTIAVFDGDQTIYLTKLPK